MLVLGPRSATRSILLVPLVAILLFLGLQATSVSAATLYACDSFDRTLTDAWGNADCGGGYSLKGNAASFDVNNSTGKILLTSPGASQAAYLMAVSARDYDATFRFSSSKVASGGAQTAGFIIRRANGSYYLARINLSTRGGISLRFLRQAGGKAVAIGSSFTASGLVYAGKSIQVHVQVAGINPTTLRMRVWQEGGNEPGSWQLSATDSTESLQRAGGVGFQVRIPGATTNAPILFSFDDLQVAGTDSPPPPPPPASANKIYWGALVNAAAPSSANLQTGGVFANFEARAGKKMSLVHWGQPWMISSNYQAFPTTYMNNVRQHGSIPFLDWGSWHLGHGASQSNFQLRDIYGGTYDNYIRTWATAAKSWGQPLFLRFDWEMNGWWQFPWVEKINGNSPGDYVKMWRHVHDIFTSVGASNVTWVWCPNIMSTSDNYTRLSTLYPGDSYVDWTCLDGYNKESTWQTFSQVFGGGQPWMKNSYQEVLNLAPNKPMAIAETASREAGDGGAKKAAWIRDAFLTQLPSRFPQVKAVMWFDWNDGDQRNTYPIESSSAATKAFADSISSSYYATNNYGNLSTSPIPPP